MFLCSLRYCLKCYFSKGVYSFTLSTVHLCVCVCVCVCVFIPAVGDDVAVTLLKGQFYRVIRVIKIKQKKSLLS